MAAIRSLRARPVDVPMPKPVETAAGTLRTTPLVLIDVTTDEGVAGHAYVRAYTRVALEPLARLIANLEPLVGTDLCAHFRLLGTQGLTGIAIAGIDMAIHDAEARTRGVPLVTLLGGEPKPVPAYAGLRSMSARAAIEEAEEAVGRGFTAVKLKASVDLEPVRAVKAALGDDVKLMVDFNQSRYARPARRERQGSPRHREDRRRPCVRSRHVRRAEDRRRHGLVAGRRAHAAADLEPRRPRGQCPPARRHPDRTPARVPRPGRADPARARPGRAGSRIDPGPPGQFEWAD